MAPGFDALGFTFTVTATDARVGAYLEHVLDGLRSTTDAEHRYAIIDAGPGRSRRHVLTLDDSEVSDAEYAESLVTSLVHHVNREAIERVAGPALHAGGVEHDEIGAVFPGRSEAGKSTLVAALVRAGLLYLSDEAVALDRDTRLIRPYPKPLSLDPGAWSMFPELEPCVELPTERYKEDQWQVAPQDLGRVGSSCPLGVIAFPHYSPTHETALLPISRAEALIELANNTFGFKESSRANLETLTTATRSADCYRFMIGDLAGAVDVITKLLGASASPAGRNRR